MLLAAGASRRMGGGTSKALLRLGERTVLERSAAALLAAPSVTHLVVVTRPDDRDDMLRALTAHGHRVHAMADGGEQRTDSVRAGVEAMTDDVDVVLVHDAARCFVDPDDVERVAHAAFDHGASLLATRVRDTLKHSSNGHLSNETVDRDRLWSAETPQAMRIARFRDVLSRAVLHDFCPTDDAALHEHYHGPTKLVEGRGRNIKITTPADVALGEALASVLDAEQQGAGR